MSAAGRVWYVSYGSNLNRARFLAYLQGGCVAGNDVVHAGCADPSPPLRDVALELPHSLYFAGHSKRSWGGTSAAFVMIAPHAPPALARAYLITEGQFLDVVRQENAHGVVADGFDERVAQAREHGHARLLRSGTYSELVYSGMRDGHPMLTFTAPEDRKDLAAPSAAYLRVIGSGLTESHGLSTAQVVAYLGGRPGVRDAWTLDQLAEILEWSDAGGGSLSEED